MRDVEGEGGEEEETYLMLGTLKFGNDLEGLPLFDLLISVCSSTLRDTWGHRVTRQSRRYFSSNEARPSLPLPASSGTLLPSRREDVAFSLCSLAMHPAYLQP